MIRFVIIFFTLILQIVASGSVNSLQVREIAEKEFSIKMVSSGVAQGDVVAFNLQPHEKFTKLKLIVRKKVIPFEKYNNGYLAMLPVDPEFPRDRLEFRIFYRVSGDIYNRTKLYNLQVKKGKFREYKISGLRLNKKYTQKKYSKNTMAFINKSLKLKNKAFAKVRKILVSGSFRLPVNHTNMSSNFYARRKYNDNEKGKPHRGIDLRGKTGDPIYAIQDGKVEIARKMYFEGKFTVINHGHNIFSLYMHQSKLLVKEGDFVKKGDLIGRIGSTGMSTGPHLHLGVKVHDTYVDPMSLISLKL